ncbi:MAG: hypothetical protein R3F37_17995 [Candidatus Competibacteraceae bacterium]
MYRPKGKGDLKPLVEGAVCCTPAIITKSNLPLREDSYVYIFQVDSACHIPVVS